jgi:hypothetical protein
MKIFRCDSCEQVTFFESFECTRCHHALAFLPDQSVVSSLEPVDNLGKIFRAMVPSAGGQTYLLCQNYLEHGVCNWAIPTTEVNQSYCRACRLNHVIPDISDPQSRRQWHLLEIAKRRLIYTLLALGLPVESKIENPERGLAFDFLKEGETQVFTGHYDGLITINIAEADDPFREKMREQLGETYRTVLGHFRHESGHYYWQRLVASTPHHDPFRALFGDEEQSYEDARRRHYEMGAPSDWWDKFVSAYASMHPLEDWAETWAHYLHMVDGLETARAHGLSLQPPAAGPGTALSVSTRRLNLHSFDDLLKGWIPLTLSLNSMNRSFGMKDCYPFVLAPAAIEKLRFVHHLIESSPV